MNRPVSEQKLFKSGKLRNTPGDNKSRAQDETTPLLSKKSTTFSSICPDSPLSTYDSPTSGEKKRTFVMETPEQSTESRTVERAGGLVPRTMFHSPPRERFHAASLAAEACLAIRKKK